MFVSKNEVQRVSVRRAMTAGAIVFLAYKDNSVYYHAASTAPYVMRLDCK